MRVIFQPRNLTETIISGNEYKWQLQYLYYYYYYYHSETENGVHELIGTYTHKQQSTQLELRVKMANFIHSCENVPALIWTADTDYEWLSYSDKFVCCA